MSGLTPSSEQTMPFFDFTSLMQCVSQALLIGDRVFAFSMAAARSASIAAALRAKAER
jgi:hypothetical protein